MLTPLSWIREYVPIKMGLKDLAWKLTEVGLGVEKIDKNDEDTIFDIEITPNRPDLLSIGGIAREIAAIEKLKAKFPTAKIPTPKKKLPLTVKNNYQTVERFTAIVMSGITIKPSPLWLSERLVRAGLRSINNVVDITNYVMLELGNPIHAFDYDEIEGSTMIVSEAEGGEVFTTVDNLTYKLPKNAIIIKDKERIIDLCGIKGGKNSGIKEATKNIVIHVPVYDGKLIRRASAKLGLRSEASSIFERGVNKGGTVEALARVVQLVKELADGEVASEVIDLKKKQFSPWELSLRIEKLNSVLGIEIDEDKIMDILGLLNLEPKKEKGIITVTIPTYRNDLQIEEDLIEEVARMYGYNKFPKTMPRGAVPTTEIPYKREYETEDILKRLIQGMNLTEVVTYSLISKVDTKQILGTTENMITVSNPISNEFEILRPTQLVTLLKAIQMNTKFFDEVRIFELGKVYLKDEKKVKEPRYFSAALYNADFYDVKGITEVFFEQLHLPLEFKKAEISKPFSKVRSADIYVNDVKLGTIGEVDTEVSNALNFKQRVAILEIDLETIIPVLPKEVTYKNIAKFPPIVEDMSLILDHSILTGAVINEILSVSKLIKSVTILDIYENSRTFRITYQDPERNLTNVEVAEVRRKILTHLESKLKASLKQ